MKKESEEDSLELISIFGDEKVERAFSIRGSKKVSLAELNHQVRNKKVRAAIEEGKDKKIIMRDYGISRATYYRIKGSLTNP